MSVHNALFPRGQRTVNPQERLTAPPVARLTSLDQFRGYTVLGMFVVNFVSGYANIPRWLHFEHTYCSYHDTVMPQFFLAVGFALRLTFLRRRTTEWAAATYRRFVKRGLGLMLLGAVVYHLTGSFSSWDQLAAAWNRDGAAGFLVAAVKRGPFETLTHIGLTTIAVLPVIAAPGWVRAAYAAAAGVLHAGLSFRFYFDWNLMSPVGIDGGPLGFLTWIIPVIAGTLAHDWVMRTPPDSAGGAGVMFGYAVVLMLLGYGLSCLNRVTPPNGLPDAPSIGDYAAHPPFVPPPDRRQAEAVRNYWTMSQRTGSVTYQTFAAGFGLVVLAAFRVLCDGWRLRSDYLGLLGRNALAGYLIHGVVGEAVKPFVPKDAPAAYVWAAFAAYLGVTTLFLRYLDRNRLYLRL
jgi:predicted acyltransferase